MPSRETLSTAFQKDDKKLSRMTFWILVLTIILIVLTIALVYSEFSTTKVSETLQSQILNPFKQKNTPENKNNGKQYKNNQSHDLPPQKEK